MNFIGVDLGTSSIKMILIDNSGDIKKIVSRDYPLYMEGNCSEQNPQDWFDQFVVGVKELVKDCDVNSIDGISFSGQMHGLVTLDDNDNVIRNAILWNDQRTTKECDYLNNTIGKDVLLENVGNIALTGFTAPKILWMKDNEPQLFSKIKKIMLPKDYLAYKLSGVFATDYSDCSGMLLLDVKNKCYSKKLLDIVGITEDMLPKLYESYDVIGTITEEISKLTGLSTSTKVIIGGGDQAVGAIGTGTVMNNTASISLGTSGVVFVASDNYAVDKEKSAIHSFCHSNGKYHLMGVTLSAAASTKWWSEDILQSSHKDTQSNISNVENNKIYFLPYLTGERTPINDPNATGVFVGMNTTTKTEDMTLAVLEGVAFSLKDILVRINEMGIKVTNARIIGGGAKSPLWCQIISNVLNIDIENINSEEGPALGAAILAMVGCGEYKDVDMATSKIIGTTNKYCPNKDLEGHYKKKFDNYKKIYYGLEKTFFNL